MSKIELLRAFVSQRLTAASEEIFGAVESIVTEYEEDISKCKQELEQHRMLLRDVLGPQIRLYRIDESLNVFLPKEEVSSESHEQENHLDHSQPDPTPCNDLQLKKEEQECDVTPKAEDQQSSSPSPTAEPSENNHQQNPSLLKSEGPKNESREEWLQPATSMDVDMAAQPDTEDWENSAPALDNQSPLNGSEGHREESHSGLEQRNQNLRTPSRSFHFSCFGKTRKTVRTVDDILQSIQKMVKLGVFREDFRVCNDGMWGDICKDLQLPHSLTYRRRIKGIYRRHFKSLFENQDQEQVDKSAVCPQTVIWKNEASLADNEPIKYATPPKEGFHMHNGITELSQDSASSGEDETPPSLKCLTPKPGLLFINKYEWRRRASLSRTPVDQCHFQRNAFSPAILQLWLQAAHFQSKGVNKDRFAVQRFTNCLVTLKVKVDKKNNMKAVVIYRGKQTCHSTVVLTKRPVHADSRDELEKSVDFRLPRPTYLESLSSLSKEAMLSILKE